MLKATGMTRKVDELGRIVLPVELRRTMNIAEGDALEIFVEGNHIILRRYDNAVAIQDDLQRIAARARDDLPTDKATKVDALLRQLAGVLKQ